MEQRGSTRINVVGMEVDLPEKAGFRRGTLKDVSRSGVCLVGTPLKMHDKKSIVAVIVSADGKRFSLQLRPKWEKQDELMLVTGAMICDAPSEWMEMIMRLEREDEEAWSLTH